MPRRRWPSSALAAVMLVLTLLGLAGQAPKARGEDAPVASLPSGYWDRPLAEQGEAPQAWIEIERSLAPGACGECHMRQADEWRTSLHAKAFSPGLVGQLLTFDAAGTARCMDCHAPLAEQKQAFEQARAKGVGHLTDAQGLAAFGNSCAGCHVRRHQRFGPPQRDTELTGPSNDEMPHGGVTRTTDFEESSFCSTCHQFPLSMAVNGKPLENTFVEWQASPQAAAGQTCQTCHMPSRRHEWRGIHDPEMVRDGLTATFAAEVEAARFSIANTGVGHAFPSYVTPKVILQGVALDAAGQPVGNTAASYVIQRVVAYSGGRWIESSDTRLLPNQSATLSVPWKGYDRVRFWLEVHPDDYYDRRIYDSLLASFDQAGPATTLIAEADALAAKSSFRLFEMELTHPR